MEEFFQSFEVSDLTLGKPAVQWLSTTATIADALKALKELHAREISVWDFASESESCFTRLRKHEQLERVSGLNGGGERRDPRCVGKVNILDIICYLAKEDCIRRYDSAALDPVSVLLPSSKNPVKHVDSSSRLSDVFNLMLYGAQYLIVPRDSPRNRISRYNQCNRKLNQVNYKSGISAAAGLSSKKHQLNSYCWITQEDVLRFMLGCIGIFSPLPIESIENLGIINTDVLLIDVNAKASAALPLISRASRRLSAVAVVEGGCTLEHVKDGFLGPKLVGEISISTFKNCDELAALALASYSVKEFLAFAHDGGSKRLKDLANFRLDQKLNLTKLAVNISSPYLALHKTPDYSSSEGSDSDLWELSSADESLESSFDASSEKSSGSISEVLSSQCSSMPKEHGPMIACRPWSSLVAVMAQALAHRSGYVWVTDDDRTLIGIVTYYDIIDALLKHLESLK